VERRGRRGARHEIANARVARGALLQCRERSEAHVDAAPLGELGEERAYGATTPLFCLVWGFVRDDDDLGVPLAAPVHPPEPLDHPLPSDQVANGVIGVEIHTDLTGSRGDHERRALGSGAAPSEEAELAEARGRELSLVHAAPTDE